MSTITDKSVGTHIHDANISSMVPNFIKLFVRARFSNEFLMETLRRASGNAFRVIMKSAPGTNYDDKTFSTQAHIMYMALNTMSRQLSFENGFTIGTLYLMFEAFGNYQALVIMKAFMDLNHKLSDIGVHLSHSSLPAIGKIGFKDEPAGKIRVFAMVDGFTNVALAPLHDLIFAILRDVPMDGTFDQTKPILRMVHSNAILQQNAEGEFVPTKGKSFFSLDLSAATDRLPVVLQQLILEELLQGIIPNHIRQIDGGDAGPKTIAAA